MTNFKTFTRYYETFAELKERKEMKTENRTWYETTVQSLDYPSELHNAKFNSLEDEQPFAMYELPRI